MSALPEWMSKMKVKADAVKERMNRQGPGFKRWDLQGKNAVVSEGRSLIMRLLPRWDFAQSFIVGRDGKPARNPNYVEDAIFFDAAEHWWDTPDGKRARAWCPRSLNPDATCPLCDASDELRGSRNEEERRAGSGMRAKEVFLFNAILRDPKTGATMIDEAGLVDIRYVTFNATLYVGLSNIITGGESESFARGDVSHVREGYDLQLFRPPSNVERWRMDAAANKSPLFHPKDNANAWKGWMQRLIDLSEVVTKDMKTSDVLYQDFHGVPPDPDQIEPDDMGMATPVGVGPKSPQGFDGNGHSVTADFGPGPDMDLIGPGDMDPSGAPIDMPDMPAPTPARPATAVRGRPRGR